MPTITSDRSPEPNDIICDGAFWINKVEHELWICASIDGGVAVWWEIKNKD